MEINGKKVIDAKHSIDVHVQKEDCQKGKTKDAAACAAAQAIMREHPEILGARVHRGCTYLEYDKHWKRHRTPTSLREELTVFDRSGKFEPSDHTLGVFSESQTLPGMKEYRQVQRATTPDSRVNHSNNKKKRARHEIPNIRPRGANR